MAQDGAGGAPLHAKRSPWLAFAGDAHGRVSTPAVRWLTVTRLVGKRLILRELVEEDWPAVHDYSSRPEVVRYQPWGPNTPEESRATLASMMAHARATPRSQHHLAVTLRNGGRLVGEVQFKVHSVDHGQGEIGYFLHPDVWSQGYATEAARLLLAFGFAELRMHRIMATCDPRNSASWRVLEKLGMTREGHLRQTMRLRDGWRDSLVYSILVDEWRATTA